MILFSFRPPPHPLGKISVYSPGGRGERSEFILYLRIHWSTAAPVSWFQPSPAEYVLVQRGSLSPETKGHYSRPGVSVCNHDNKGKVMCTWLFHTFLYPSLPLHTYILVPTIAAVCPALEHGQVSPLSSGNSGISSQV